MVVAVHVYGTAVGARGGRLPVFRDVARVLFHVGVQLPVLPPHDVASAEVVDEERYKESSHEDGCCDALVVQLPDAWVREHEMSMSEELHGR